MSIKGIIGNMFGSTANTPVQQPQGQGQQAQAPAQTDDSFQQSGNNSTQPGGVDLSKAAEILTKTPKAREAEVNWALPSSNGFMGSPVLADENHLVYSTYNKGFICLNPITKETIWEKNVISPSETYNNKPVRGMDNDILISSGHGKQIASIDTTTGNEKWRIDLKESMQSAPIIGNDGNIHVNMGNKVITFDGKTQKQLSETPVKCETESPPVIGRDGTIYIGGSDGSLHALENGSGREKWSYKTGSMIRVAPVLGNDGTVYCGSNDHKLHAVNPITGEKKWEFETGNLVITEPSIGNNGEVILGSMDNNVYFLDPQTGREKWKFETDGEIRTTPKQLKDGTVWIVSDRNQIYGVNPENGVKQWSNKAPSYVHCSPDSDERGNFYMECNDSKLYSYKIPSARERMEALKAKADPELAAKKQKDMSVKVEDDFVIIGGIKLEKKKN
ncbi:MAG: PQQ-binding-like beta-propeller repeat protein [Firmicutes bacterium]|nr:PQQ-binding-like beta-propeller repeat protein [Bacillota bacterium]